MFVQILLLSRVTEQTLTQVSGRNGVSRHGDDPQQAYPSLLLWLMLSTTQVTPVVNCEEQTGRQ